MRNFVSHHVSAAAIGALLIAGAASATPARAQMPDARWQPWLGCWTQVSETRPAGSATGATGLVCVVPAQTGDGVEVAVMADGKLLRSELIAATNGRKQKTIESCPGWETVVWSADGRRLLARSEVRCAQTAVKSSSIFSISSEGEWIEVRGALVGTNSTVSVVRYRPAAFALKRVATEVGGEVQPFTLVSEVGVASRYARLAAGDRVDADAVLDVARHVDSPVAEAWLNELQQGFDLDAKELVRIADAGMPANVIDLMVALSNPEVFAVRRNAEAGQHVNPVRRGGFAGGYGRRYGSVYDCGYGFMPTTYGYYGDPCYPGYYGYGVSGYGYGSGYYGYGYPYGYGTYGGYYYGSRPLVIVPAGTYTDQQRGQAVKGGGYTRRGGGYTPSTSRPQSSGTSRDASAGSSSSGSSGSSTGSSSSSGSTGSSGGDGGRTAKPRVPPGS